MNVDWELLRDQKMALLLHVGQGKPLETETIDGIINFIDAFQDWSIDQGNATEEEVFGN